MSHRKPPESRQRRNKTAPFTILRVNRAPERGPSVPGPDRDWEPGTRRAWATFWQDGTSQVVAPVDEPAIRRLFGFYSAFGRLWEVFLREPLVKGSTGQQVVNPVGTFALQVVGRIERLERAFGITPRARASLGLTFAEAKATLEDLAVEAHREAGDVEAEPPGGGGAPASP